MIVKVIQDFTVTVIENIDNDEKCKEFEEDYFVGDELDLDILQEYQGLGIAEVQFGDGAVAPTFPIRCVEIVG